MADDLKILLPEGTKLQELRISDSFDKYDDCMQRAVILTLLDPTGAMRINDLSLPELLRRGNTATVSVLNAGLSSLSSTLKYMLNTDGEEVSELSLTAEMGDDNRVSLIINIIKESGDTLSGSVTL